MFTPNNRFHLVHKLIEVFPEKREAGITPELLKLNHDSVFLMWDAFKIVLVDQKLADQNDKFVKANSKNGRKSKLGIAISRETVYVGECVEWLNKMMTFDAGLLDDMHGDRPKYSNKELEGGFLPVQMNFGSGNNNVDLNPDSVQDDWVDDDESDDISDSLEDRIAEKVVKRLTAVIDSKLKPFSKLFDRVKKLEQDFEGIRKHVSKHKTDLENNVNKKLQQLDVANIVAKQEEIDQQLEKLKKAREDFNDAIKMKDNVKSKKPPASAASPNRFHVWGRNSADSGAPAIPRFFNFAVSKIPNKDDYSTDWFKENQQKIFDRRNLKATIIEVEQIKATFPNARTKTFKVLVMTEDMEVSIENFLEQRLWTFGLSISKYKRPRLPRPDLVASHGLEN